MTSEFECGLTFSKNQSIMSPENFNFIKTHVSRIDTDHSYEDSWQIYGIRVLSICAIKLSLSCSVSHSESIFEVRF